MAELEVAVGQALGDAGRKIERAARGNTKHPSVAKTIASESPRRDAQGPYVIVRYRKGLGPIFEGGTNQRFTRKGANRGLIQPGEFALRRARDSVLKRGINLRRYL